MALQICPKCQKLSFTWFTDEDQTSLTQWGCECGYHACEDESKLSDCPICDGKKSDRLIIDSTGKY
jgi:hypothetical protein